MIARGSKLNWRKHLTQREGALITRAELLMASVHRLEAEIKVTNWQAIVDRAVERARSAGDFRPSEGRV